MIFDSIPSQLASHKNKFYLSKIVAKKVTTKDKELLFNLIDSKTVLICYNVNDPNIALNLTKDLDKFKLYILDIGLFTTMLFNDKNLVSENIYNKLLSNKLDANLGYLYENAVAQIIAANDRKLYYHTWYDKDKRSSYEVDFLTSDNNKIIPIEVKSSDVNNHSSINKFSNKYSSCISRRILFSQNDIGHDNMLELIPIYLAPVVISLIK